MEYAGRVKGGVVVLEDAGCLPEGVRVCVRPIEPGHEAGALGERLLRFAGIADELPSDMAENHNHYIHGAPKE